MKQGEVKTYSSVCLDGIEGYLYSAKCQSISALYLILSSSLCLYPQYCNTAKFPIKLLSFADHGVRLKSSLKHAPLR